MIIRRALWNGLCHTVRLADLQYELPAQLIARRPCRPRDAARLMVIDRTRARIEHRVFRDIGNYLEPNDCLVLNDTRVIPARFFCRRATGGVIEALFLEAHADAWSVLLKPSARLHEGELLHVENDACEIELVTRRQRGMWTVRPRPAIEPHALLDRVGQTPLPPYIQRDHGPDADDQQQYQTVYAAQPGAVAAPTAGLHFTPGLLTALARRGVRRTTVTLHVGLGTFSPIEAEELSEHHMHVERFTVSPAAAESIAQAQRDGGRLVAVGTTAVRVLESGGAGPVTARSTRTDIFIYPPHEFQHTDRLITNFHLPGSTLLALVAAFCGVELTRRAYADAIERCYRFYSYGDAMLIL